MPDVPPFRSFAIVPAAGRSQRMGRPKLLLPWQGATVIEHVLAAWKASRVEQIVVVVHPQDRELAQVCRQAGVEVVVPQSPPPEMKISVQEAVAWIGGRQSPSAADVWLLAPADMPGLPASAIDQVLNAHDPGNPSIIVPRHGDRCGHPVLFPWPLADEVARLGRDEGLNRLRQRFPVREIELPDAAILADLDTPEDYRRLQQPQSQPT
jgi:molybdenum cofactor cytidylyltransferase